jgi:hypothetical protein
MILKTIVVWHCETLFPTFRLITGHIKPFSLTELHQMSHFIYVLES